jgi:6-phosphogluconolactonase
MKGWKWALPGLIAAVLLAGCKGFWDPVTTTGTGGTTSGTASGVFYVLNQKTAQVAGFSFASGSTTPAAITGGSATLAAAPLAVTISPSGSFLYVSTTVGIYLYTIGSGGTLTLGNSGQAISADPAFTMVVDPTDQWLIEAVSGTGTLSAIPLDTSTGLYNSSLQVASLTLPNTNVQQVAISPSGAASPYLFVAMGAGGTEVIPFTAANATPFGNGANIAVENSNGGAANTVAVDPSNRLLYVGETAAIASTQSQPQTGGLRAFTIGATSLTEIAKTPYSSGGTGPSAILPTADYVYVANKAVSGASTGNIAGFAITSTAGVYTLTSVSTIAAGVGTSSLAEDSTSTYVLAANAGGGPDLSTYTFDTTTAGKLDAAATVATGSDPVVAVAVAAVP